MEEIKKFLVAIFPIFVVLFVLVWILIGLKDALVFFGLVLFLMALGFGFATWIEFVDKHM